MLAFILPQSAQAQSIEITPPTDISNWTFNPSLSQPQTQTGTCIINVTNTTDNWTLTARDLNATTSGYMTEWDGSNYVTNGAKLHNAMNISATSEVMLPEGGTIANGTGNATVPVTFKQQIGYSDVVLASNTYRIVVTFEASLVI
jgi:hypothetical protein